MNDIDTLHKELAAERRTEQVRLRGAFSVCSPVERPPELELALHHRLSFCPVACAALRPPDRAIVGVPRSELEQIAWWWAQNHYRHLPNLNWGVATGRQGRDCQARD